MQNKTVSLGSVPLPTNFIKVGGSNPEASEIEPISGVSFLSCFFFKVANVYFIHTEPKTSWRKSALPGFLILMEHCLPVELGCGIHINRWWSTYLCGLVNRSDIHSHIPFVTCRKWSKLGWAVPQYFSGQGTNGSSSDIWCFGCLPYVYFRNLASVSPWAYKAASSYWSEKL